MKKRYESAIIRHATDCVFAGTLGRERPGDTARVPICTPKTLKIWNMSDLPAG